MSAIPTPATVAEPRRLTIPAPAVRFGRTVLLVAAAMLVPGEAARLASGDAPARHRSV